MTPVELFVLICIFALVRGVLTLRPVRVGPSSVEQSADVRLTSSPSIDLIIREYLDAFIVAGLVALFLITFVVRTFYIPSGSMEPTLQIHDVLLVNEFEYRFHQPHEGDIVVFRPPISTTNDFIKRVIGCPGETFRIQGGTVYRNGAALAEPYIAEKPDYSLEVKNYGIYVDGQPLDPTMANVPPRAMWQAPDRIPNGFYFMMGDNRNNSEDSHIWGFAQPGGLFAAGPEQGRSASFTGHAFLLFWPPNRMHIFP